MSLAGSDPSHPQSDISIGGSPAQKDCTTTPNQLKPSTTELIDQLSLTIQCLDEAVQLAEADDPAYSALSRPFSSADGPELWSEVEGSIDRLFDSQTKKMTIRRGEHGLQRLVTYLQRARKHPTWVDRDEVLEPKLKRVLDSVADRCTQSKQAPETQEADGDEPMKADPGQLPEFEPPLSNRSTPEAIGPQAGSLDRLIAELQNGADPSPNGRKRNSTTVAQKLEVIEYHNRTGETQKETASRFGLTQSQLSRWLKEEEELREYVMDKGASSKRQRTGDFPHIEETLLRYFIEAKSRNVSLSDEALKERTKAFMKLYGVSENSLKVSNGWLLRFKGRNSVRSYVRPTSSLKLPDDQIVKIRESLRKFTDSYPLRDIYVAGETSVFCNLAPLTGPMNGNLPEKIRLTYLLCTNADGSDKIQPLVAGPSQDQDAYMRKPDKKPFFYRYTTRGMISGPVFSEWIKKFDRQMQRQNRKVVLLIDNFSGHVYDSESLINTKIRIVPTTLISQLHPLNVGIIQTFKSNYRRNLIDAHNSPEDKALSRSPQAEQRQAMECAQSSWDQITSTTIQNCFRHTAIIRDRLQDGLTIRNDGSRPPEFTTKYASDLDMETSLMATQSALIQLQRDLNFTESTQMTFEQFLSFEGEDDRISGWESMPSDEDIVREAKFHSTQCKEELRKRKLEELEEINNRSNKNRTTKGRKKKLLTNARSATNETTENFENCVDKNLFNEPEMLMSNDDASFNEDNGGGGSGANGSVVCTTGILDMIPMSVQEMLSSLDNLEYSIPFYVSEESISTHLDYLKTIRQDLRKALTGPYT